MAALARRARLRRAAIVFGAVIAAAFVTPKSGFAQGSTMNIQKVVSASGVEAWLVEDHNTPLIAMQFAFRAGAAQEPADKAGLSYFVSGTLDEGAGDLPGRQFQQRMEELATKISFDAGLDWFTGSLQSLTVNKAASFDLLRKAITAPRFEPADVERIRSQILSRLQIEAQDPETVASKAWFKLAFGAHPYARSVKGSVETVKTITPDDLRDFTRRAFTRDGLKVSVVGDITPDELKAALDEIFGGLPAKSGLEPAPEATLPTGRQTQVIQMANPQSVAVFGAPGLKRKDPDFIPAFIINYILGGGGFASTLTQEVREKRGLAYSVYSYLYPLDRAGLLLGGVATENKSVKQSLDVIEAEMERLAKEGPDATTLANAKQYLTGSYALRFDSSVKIAGQLLGAQMEDLGIEYIAKRNDLINAVTMEDVKRVAARLLGSADLITTVVGAPEGLETSAPAATRG
ncbi:MAG: pitrilysin family protein [Hyphomicrobiales bacterium]|nr:pitrilysin family protein [Hyphomicrobiales bacterium]